MSYITQVENLMNVQRALNKSILGNDWLTQGKDFMLAASVESTEAVDCTGWEWWKKSELAVDSMKMELVDVALFTFSQAMVELFTPKQVAIYLQEGFGFDYQVSDTIQLCKKLQVSAARGLVISTVVDLAKVSDSIGMDMNELYALYIGKAVLNGFRQDNGYKLGDYPKDWNGVSDNSVLIDICRNLKASAFNNDVTWIQRIIRDQLQEKFDQIVDL